MFKEPFALFRDGRGFIVFGFRSDEIQPFLAIVALQVGCENCGDKPILDRLEVADFLFSFDNHLDRNRLDAACGESTGDFFP
ncbi:hypothetical protein ES703_59530 [subsurface metagenome]